MSHPGIIIIWIGNCVIEMWRANCQVKLAIAVDIAGRGNGPTEIASTLSTVGCIISIDCGRIT